MKTLNVLALLAILSIGVVHAGTPNVTVTHDPQDIKRCTLVAQVTATPPFILPGADIRDLKKQTASLQADTVIVTSRGLVTQGYAYRCH